MRFILSMLISPEIRQRKKGARMYDWEAWRRDASCLPVQPQRAVLLAAQEARPRNGHGSRALLAFVAMLVAMGSSLMPVAIAGPEPERNLQEEAAMLFRPIPHQAPDLKDNPASPAKVELGKMLFFDPRLSASQIISCNTCHNVRLGGIDSQETSVGHRWGRGDRNAPTVFNSVFNVGQFWDGRASDLAEQAKQPIVRSIEMGNAPGRVIETLKSIPAYPALFKQAFPTDRDPVNFENIAKAIEAFEATLLTPDSPIDRYLRGDKSAISEAEKEGLMLFIDRNCASCHYGVNFGGMGYYTFGMVIDPEDNVRPAEDLGRFKVTGIIHDRYRFRAGPLRNVVATPPYFHAGRVWNLIEAVKVMGSIQLGRTLNQEEAQKIAHFLGTLTGKQPDLRIPHLPSGGPGTPRPILGLTPGKSGKK